MVYSTELRIFPRDEASTTGYSESGSRVRINPPIRVLELTLLLPLLFILVLDPSPLLAANGNDGTGASSAHPFSAEDFDWREMIPTLARAAELPGDQAVKELLENSGIFRTYIVKQLWAECKADENRCASIDDASSLQREVTRRIDDIVSKSMFTRDKMAIVDYSLDRQPFPFSEVAAYKSQKHQDAYFTLALAGKSYTSLRVKAKYGAPFGDDIVQWYGVYKYRVDNPDYRSEAVFEIDPRNDAVIKIAISLKARKNHSRSKLGEGAGSAESERE